jgi:hypothetical protein
LFQAAQNQTAETVTLEQNVAEREQVSQVTIAPGAIGRDNWRELNKFHFEAASHHVVYAARGKNDAPTLIVRDIQTNKKVEPRSAFALEVPDE